jgi:hypothetical protein
MLRMPRGVPRRTRPPFHEAQPILYTAEAEAAVGRGGERAPAGAAALPHPRDGAAAPGAPRPAEGSA